MTKFHTKNVSSAKALGRIRVRPEKVAEFIHRQHKKRRRKNPDRKYCGQQRRQLQTLCTTNYSRPFSTYSPSHTHTHTHIQTPPCNHLLTTNPNPPTIWKQPCFGQGPQRVTSRNEISPRPKSMKYQKDISSQNTTVGTHTFLTMGHGSVHSISRILQRHPSLPSLTSHIITNNLIPPTEPSYHYGRNSRPVKSFSSILIDLL